MRRRKPRYHWGAECPTCRAAIDVWDDSLRAIQAIAELWHSWHPDDHGKE